MTHFSCRGLSSLRRVLALCGLTLAAFSLSGCTLIQGPPKASAPPVVEKPKFPVFDPADYLTPWPTKMPGTYRVTDVLSGELLTIQGVNAAVGTAATGTATAGTATAGTATPGTRAAAPQYGVTETVRLAGIVAPAPGQPGWQNTVNKINEWLAGKTDLEVEVDPKYPVDLQNHRMVQIYFRPSAKGGARGASASASGPRWNLNRMLVHTGYAVVDLYSATSVDVQKWLNDEEFAKNFVDPRTGQTKPLGLWGLGITVPQRGLPVRGRSAIAIVPGAPSAIGSTVQGSLQSRRTTQTQQTTRTTTQGATSSTGTTAVPSMTAPAATTPAATAPAATSSTTTSASRSTATRSVTTPSSSATNTTSSATNTTTTAR